MFVFEAFERVKKLNYRDPDLEAIIATHAQTSYLYAYNVIKERFALGEKAILEDHFYTFLYAQHVIKGAFTECHPWIFNSSARNDYLLFLKYIKYDLKEIEEWLI